jgi:hypothetical protein
MTRDQFGGAMHSVVRKLVQAIDREAAAVRHVATCERNGFHSLTQVHRHAVQALEVAGTTTAAAIDELSDTIFDALDGAERAQEAQPS